MNGDEQKLYRELVEERKNCNGWFHTPPPWSPEKTAEQIELANRVLAEYEERSQRAKREYVMYFQEEKRANELLSRIPDAEETLWGMEMREHTRMAYRTKSESRRRK